MQLQLAPMRRTPNHSIKRHRGLIGVMHFMLMLMAIGLSNDGYAVSFSPNRADFLYNMYDGDGTTVSGPSILVQKAMSPNSTIGVHYFADVISSASIETSAGTYQDRRNEIGLDVEYGHSAAILNVGFDSVQEDDFSAKVLEFDISQDVFNGSATLHLGGSRSWDTVQKKGTKFEADASRHAYRVGATSLITSKTAVNIDYEATIDEGYLANPYSSARILGATAQEKIPLNRTMQAVAIRLAQSLTSRFSIATDYRYFWDSWGIDSHTVEPRLSVQLGAHWLAEIKARYYTQTEAAFYADNFAQELNYMSRDKLLSRFSSYSMGFKVQLELFGKLWRLHRGTVSIGYDKMYVDYDNFTDNSTNAPHAFSAGLTQTMLSIWY